MNEMESVALTAARLEVAFSKIAQAGANAKLTGDLEGYTVLDVGTFPGNGSIKAITVMDPDGNVYVHFNGTGNGNWGYNSAAYGTEASEMQAWASRYFDRMVTEHYEGRSAGRSLYVTGHSQGGNNAQYVTMNSEHGDYIDACVSLDGPGMSHSAVEAARNRYGEAYYEQQRDKLYAYNGQSDYVSCLGQENIIPEDHTYIVALAEGYHPEADNPFNNYHDSHYLLDGDGNFVSVTPYSYDGNSEFRKLVLALNEQITALPQDQQYAAAQATMALIEQMMGSRERVFTEERLADLRAALVPVISGFLAEHPEMIVPALNELGLFSPELAELVGIIVDHFDTLPEGLREAAVAAILDTIVIDADGNLGFEWRNLFRDGNFLPTLTAGIPLLVETFLYHPENLVQVVQQLGLDAALAEYMEEHPFMAVVLTVLSPLMISAALDLAAVLITIDILVRVVQGIAGFASDIVNFVADCARAITNAITAIQTWLRNTFNAGVGYVRDNPYFKADPAKLRDYAGRIRSVNNRLSQLDTDLHDLYWQVGFQDLWDIMVANLLTSGSPTLLQVEGYLNHAAGLLEEAERKAHGYMGG